MNYSILWIVLAAILFGTSGVAGKFLINTYALDPLSIAATRLLIAAPILLLIGRFGGKEKTPLRKKYLIWFLLTGIAAAGYQLIYFSALKHIMVSIATLIALCTTPIFVALLSMLFLKEKIKKATYLSLICSIVGTILIIGITRQSAAGGIVGYVLALCAGLDFAVYTLSSKKLLTAYPSAKVIAFSFTLGSLCMLPFLHLPALLPFLAWALLLYMGIVTTALAYTLFGIGLKQSSATHASIGTLFEPLTSTILSIALMGEMFGFSQLIGAILLCCALLLIVFNDLLFSKRKLQNRGESYDKPCETSDNL